MFGSEQIRIFLPAVFRLLTSMTVSVCPREQYWGPLPRTEYDRPRLPHPMWVGFIILVIQFAVDPPNSYPVQKKGKNVGKTVTKSFLENYSEIFAGLRRILSLSTSNSIIGLLILVNPDLEPVPGDKVPFRVPVLPETLPVVPVNDWIIHHPDRIPEKVVGAVSMVEVKPQSKRAFGICKF
jgi:hypothetical protein